MINYVEELRNIRFTFRPEEVIDYQTLMTLAGTVLVSDCYDDYKEELFHTTQILVLVYGLEDQLQENNFSFDVNNIDLDNINTWKYLLVMLYNDMVKTNEFIVSDNVKNILFMVLNKLNNNLPNEQVVTTIPEPICNKSEEPAQQNNCNFNNYCNTPQNEQNNFSTFAEDDDLNKFNWDYLKDYIIMNKLLPYKCDCCGMNEWQGKHLSLKLSFKDPNNHEQNIENLILLCPNCFSQIGND